MRQGPNSTAPGLHGYRSKLSWIATLVLSTMLCVACVNGSAGSAQRSGGNRNLVWAKSVDAVQLDPHTGGSSGDWPIFDQVYQTLVGMDGALKPVPVLATAWRQTSAKEYVFDIRQGVKFSNGRQLTVDDVVGSLKRLLDAKTGSWWAPFLGPVTDVSAVGEKQVRVRLSRPWTSLVAALANISAAILPMKELNAGSFDPKKQLLGTGPFEVAEHSPGESWKMTRNPHYWGKAASFPGLTIRIISDDAARTAALRSGTADVATFETPDVVRLLKGAAKIKTVVQDTTDYYRLDVNARSSIFADERLRQALALSLDRKAMISVGLGGVGKPSAATPQGLDGSCDPAGLPFATPDLGRARNLVDAAGARGKPVVITVDNGYPAFGTIAQVIQSNLQAIGLKASISPKDNGAVLKAAYSGPPSRFDLIVSYTGGYADPAMVLALWNLRISPFFAGFLKDDPQLRDVIAQSLSTPPGAARTKALKNACDRIALDANEIPLVSRAHVVGYRTDTVSLNVAPLEGYSIPLRNIASYSIK